MNEQDQVAAPRVKRPAGAVKPAKPKTAKTVAAAAPEPEREEAADDQGAAIDNDAPPSWDDSNPALLTRRSRLKGDSLDNWSEIPPELKEAGWDYEWRATRVMAQDTPGAEKSFWYQQGWRPVPAKGKWLKMCEPGYIGKYVERFDQLLMMRPLHLSEAARREDFEIAEEQKWNKLEAASAVPTSRSGIVPHRDKMEIDIVVGSKPEKSAGSRQ